MIYYCKKCGAVVSGKYCANCGARSTTDLEDFRRQIKRRRREFISAKTSCVAAPVVRNHIATTAWDVSEFVVLKDISLFMNVDTFHRVADEAWRRIPEIEQNAEQFYDGAVILVTAIFNA